MNRSQRTAVVVVSLLVGTTLFSAVPLLIREPDLFNYYEVALRSSDYSSYRIEWETAVRQHKEHMTILRAAGVVVAGIGLVLLLVGGTKPSAPPTQPDT